MTNFYGLLTQALYGQYRVWEHRGMSTQQTFTPTHTAEHDGRIFMVDTTAPLVNGRLLCRGTMGGEYRIARKHLAKMRSYR